MFSIQRLIVLNLCFDSSLWFYRNVSTAMWTLSDLVSVLTALLSVFLHPLLAMSAFDFSTLGALERRSNPEYSRKNESPVVINRFRSSSGRILLQVLALTCLRSLDDSEKRCWRCCSSNYR